MAKGKSGVGFPGKIPAVLSQYKFIRNMKESKKTIGFSLRYFNYPVLKWAKP